MYENLSDDQYDHTLKLYKDKFTVDFTSIIVAMKEAHFHIRFIYLFTYGAQ